MENNTTKNDQMEKVISLSKRRGFIFQGSEIYDGLSGTWDYGPLGVALKNNVKDLWWKTFVTDREDMYGVDAAILMNPKVWEASGHLGAGFSDPMVTDLKTGERHRADHLLEDQGVQVEGLSGEEIDKIVEEKGILSPKGNKLSPVVQFNLLFPTKIGSTEESATTLYLRGETAPGMFVNFKNIIDSLHPKLPFGTAQIGKAFRNEIAPRDFIFRVREFEQMEIEYFVKGEEWEDFFETWRQNMWNWCEAIGLSKDSVHELEVLEEDRAHYSKRTIDFEYDYPFGRKELYGLAYRTDHDLKAHSDASGVSLTYHDAETNERFTPHVIEPSFGVDRTILAILLESYTEDELNGELRTVLKLPYKLAPVSVAVSPLLKNKPELQEKAREVFSILKKRFGRVAYDDNGNIGKRYRRQDEIGTPFCVTIDFDTLETEKVTVRHRDTGEQEHVSIDELEDFIGEKLA